MKLYVHYEGAAKEDTAAPLWTKRITLTPSVATFDDVLRVFCASFAKKFPSQPALTLADIDVWTERNQEMSSRKPLDKDRRAQKWIAAVLHEREGDQVGDCDFELVVVRRLDGTQPPTKVPTGVAIPVVASSSPDPTAKSSSKTSATRNHHHGHCGNSSQHVPDDHKRKEKKQHPMTSQLRVFLDLGAAQMKQHKYRSAKQLYETLILPTEPHNPEALIAIGDIHASNRQFEVAAAEWYMKCWQTHSARPCRDRANAKLAFESGLKVVTCEIQLKKYRQALEMIEKLQLFLRQESKCCGIFVPVDSSSTEKEEMEAQMDFLKAQTLYEMHASSPELQETAIALLMHLLPDLQDPNVNLDALLLYAKVAYDRGKRSEALSMALRVLVSRSSDRRVKKHLAAFLKDSEGVQRLQQVVPPESESSAAAYAFIGTILKDFGAIESSVACFEQALRGNPSCPSYALNHAHVLEVDNRYESAYAVLISFFRQNASLAVAGALTAGAILKALEMDGWESRRQAVVPTEKEQWRVEWTAKDPGYATVYLNGSVHHDRKTCGRKRSLSEQELDLLACFFTIVKVVVQRPYCDMIWTLHCGVLLLIRHACSYLLDPVLAWKSVGASASDQLDRACPHRKRASSNDDPKRASILQLHRTAAFSCRWLRTTCDTWVATEVLGVCLWRFTYACNCMARSYVEWTTDASASCVGYRTQALAFAERLGFLPEDQLLARAGGHSSALKGGVSLWRD